MSPLDPFRELFRYGDAMNDQLFNVAETLDVAMLDQKLDIGLGSVRAILRHIAAGEETWLRRWQKDVESPWVESSLPSDLVQVHARLVAVRPTRDAFLDSLTPASLFAEQIYRDSKGSMFKATLQEMLIQGVLHSHHHRAQVVNAIRRVGGPTIEVDYMYSVRKPA